MKTKTINVYSFDELNEDAKEKAIDTYRNKGYDNQYYYDEITASVKAVIELFNLKTGRTYSDIRCSHIDDTILELTGVRLYKYLINNYYSDLFKPKYIKTIGRELRCKQFICKVSKNYKGEPYTQIFSKNRISQDNCPLTGVCYDNDVLRPVYDFLKRPTKSTFEELIREIESAITKCYDDSDEWLNSDEFIKDEIEANEYEFDEDGNIL